MSLLELNVTKNFDLSKMKFDLSKQLNVAAGIIKSDIAQKIDQHRQIDGSPSKPLHPFTKSKVGNRPPLKGGGGQSLRNVGIKKATTTKQEAVIFPAKRRTKPLKGFPDGIAQVQQEGVKIKVTPKMRGYLHGQGLHLKKKTKTIEIPARPWFGISKEAEARSLIIVEEEIERRLRDV
jgi:hypothetical protein